jgi:hypothetical protein
MYLALVTQNSDQQHPEKSGGERRGRGGEKGSQYK